MKNKVKIFKKVKSKKHLRDTVGHPDSPPDAPDPEDQKNQESSEEKS